MPENTEFLDYIYDGNAAYAPAPQTEQPQEYVPVMPPPKPKPRQKVQTAYHVSLFAILGYAVVVVLIAAMLMSYVNYTTAAAEMMKYKTKIETLTKENKKLTAAYERSVDIIAIEDYARNVLAMEKPSEKQIINLTAATADTAIVYDSTRPEEKSVLEEIFDFFESLSEYFR